MKKYNESKVYYDYKSGFQKYLVSPNAHLIAEPRLLAGWMAVHLTDHIFNHNIFQSICVHMTKFCLWDEQQCFGELLRGSLKQEWALLCHPASYCLDVKAGVVAASLGHEDDGGYTIGMAIRNWKKPV